MYKCDVCNYSTTKHNSIKQHFSTKKHIILVNISNSDMIFRCFDCNKKYKYQSGLCKHKKICKFFQYNNINENSEYNIDNIDNVDNIKKDYEQKLEIEKLKNELNIKKLEIKDIEHKNLQLYVNTHQNTVKTVNNTIINNIKISKVEYLNINFGDVIDINTFIDNYKNQYGLTNKQTETLLDNYKNGGINSCISSLVYYLKESAIQQYKEIKGKEIAMADIILPFILTDKYIRDHFEKTINGQWDKTTMIDNIKKIVGITDDHVYKHHNTYMYLSDAQKKKLINGVLKASGYSKLSEISIPDLYKKK